MTQFRTGLVSMASLGLVMGFAHTTFAQDAPAPAPSPEPPVAETPPADAPPADADAPDGPAPEDEAKPEDKPAEGEAKPEEKPAEGETPAEGAAPTDAAPPPAAPPPAAPPPAAPPPAAPPPAEPAPAGAAAGASAGASASGDGATVTFGAGGPPGDTTTPDEDADQGKGPKPLAWRGTSFTWNQAFTTTTIGIGRDNIGSEDEYYGWDFYFSPRYYLLDLPEDKIVAEAEIGWGVELTNGSATQERRETQFRDLQVGASYKRNIWADESDEYATGAGLRGRFIFPTSEISSAQGKILTTAVGISANQRVKILGKEALGLNNFTLGVGLTYSHLFSESYNPTNPDLERTRQNASGQTISSDQLTTSSFDTDRLIPSINLAVPLIENLSLGTAVRWIGRFKHDFEGTEGENEACPLTGCVDADRQADRTTYDTLTTFDLNLGYTFFDVAGLTVGYVNETGQLAPDGTRRNFFYSPDAQFYVDVTIMFDGIYSKATGRDKKMASNTGAKQL